MTDADSSSSRASRDLAVRFHTEWLGLAQPVEGLVVSVPVLVDAQCMSRRSLAAQQDFASLCPPVTPPGAPAPVRRIADLPEFLSRVLDWTERDYHQGSALPEDLSLYVPEGRQTVVPTLALLRAPENTPPASSSAPASTLPDDSTPSSRAGAPYAALLWDLPAGLSLDAPETVTGPWEYAPAAKFDRLLRACRVPVGLLTNREVVRLVYAPHGESSGHITFRLDDMATVGGRALFDAFVMLLGAERFLGGAPEHRLPAILRDSRTRQASVTNELAEQLLDALHALLDGFAASAARDGAHGRALLESALTHPTAPLYEGLLTVLLRLVFVLYAEDRGLLPVEHPVYSAHFSVLELFAQLQRDQGAYPDSMNRRFGAWPRLLALFRAMFLGLSHHDSNGDLKMPPREGELFDPHRFAFLEGWGPAGSAPVNDPDAQSEVRVPTLDDGTVYRVLERLLVLEGQRLSYRALDVEQLGSVYEALMGYRVDRFESPALCTREHRVWVGAGELLAIAPARRAPELTELCNLTPAAVKKVTAALTAAKDEAGVLAALEPLRASKVPVVPARTLVIQPGPERRRTSSHYTPASLTGPIVRRTLEPLLRAMGNEPSSRRLLGLKVCDPAMGSGAFLVECCRFLADQLVAAWTREGEVQKVASAHSDVVLHARRLIAQTCLYGVDKNPLAVSLARLSLWLLTLAKDEPFTFVDHALRHGDSLVGLSLEQLRAFHWKPEKQLDITHELIDVALREGLESRLRILELAEKGAPEEKKYLLREADDALRDLRLVGDLLVGAFFAHEKDKAREQERVQRLDRVRAWLGGGGNAPEDLRETARAFRERVPTFHWAVEFPEVFYAEREDPLEGNRVNRVAWMDAFVGNPPFLGGTMISTAFGAEYLNWLAVLIGRPGNRGDLAAYFFRRASDLLGNNGAMGLVASNTISQSDTREIGLAELVNQGHVIYSALPSIPWLGDASVTVSVLHIAKGTTREHAGQRTLAGAAVPHINSRLEAKGERNEHQPLEANADSSYQGWKTAGQGFLLTPEERSQLLGRSKQNGQLIFPYIGGEEVNSSPDQMFHRYVMNFGQMSLEEAERWPDLVKIVREKVKPERDRVNRDAHRIYWWRFGEARPGLQLALTEVSRCLVNSQVSKHLVFAFQPVDRVFAHTLNVFPLSANTPFAVLQSRVHEAWARLLASSMKTDLRYTASDCFETFPFPIPDPRSVIPTLETLGEQLYALRAQYMLDATREEAPKEVGLTVLYNRLKDPRVTDPRIAHLRTLHEELDRAVLAAYGWSDIAVPAYTTPESPEEKLARERFDAAVIDRLFELNAQRAAEEKGLDPSAPSPAAPTAKPAKTRAASKSAAGEGTAGEGAPAAKKPGRKPKGAKGKGEGEGDDGGPQGALPIG